MRRPAEGAAEARPAPLHPARERRAGRGAPTRRAVALALVPLALAAGGCSFLLDFNNVEGLPCPCDQDHVCLVPQKTCFPRHGVDDFKSCDLGATNPDDLCAKGSICQAVNGAGKSCLPQCKPFNYATVQVNVDLAGECPVGTTCWDTPRGGVCAPGICSDEPNNCGMPGLGGGGSPGQECVRFNGAGVCFTPCSIFQRSPPPCAGGEVCQPVGSSAVTACVKAGTVPLGQACDDQNMCQQADGMGRPLVCAAPSPNANTANPGPTLCRAVCECPQSATPGTPNCPNTGCLSGGACVYVVGPVDPATRSGLGICEE